MKISRFRNWHATSVKRLLLTMGLLVVHAAASAAMLQQPLEVSGQSVPPNIMFTLDDSGSMQWECVPDSLCVPGSSIGIAGIPGLEQLFNEGSNNFAGVVLYDSEEDGPVRNTSGDIRYDPRPGYPSPNPLDSPLPRQLRASAYNPLYYDPQITYLPWLKADGSRWDPASPTAAPVRPDSAKTQDLTGEQTFTTNIYRSKAGKVDKGTQTAHLARYYNLKSGTTGDDKDDFELVKIEPGHTYPKGPNRTDCTANPTSCSYDEEIQNFANWYTYYRTRALMAIAGTAEAFAAVSPLYRVGYGRINNKTSSKIESGSSKSFDTIERGVRAFSGKDKEDFYTWLFERTSPSGSTPLRRAMNTVGQYFSWDDNRGPWGANPGTDDPTPHASCRRSIHLLMTDGMWNDAQASTAAARENVDGQAGPTITGPGGQTYQYTPTAPYSDSYNNTLADVAMYYWSRDLRPDLQNVVKPITTPGRENPAFWQHMVNFTIAFGVDGTLDNPGDLADLTSGAKSWPGPNISDTPAAMDDLWHAAINSRGRALSARNSTEYAAAIESIIGEIDDMSGSEAGVGVSTTTLPPTGTSSKMYTPSYSTSGQDGEIEWSGEIEAEYLDPNGYATGSAWHAASGIPIHSNRNIFTYDLVNDTAVDFKWGSLTASMQSALTAGGAHGPDLVDYLRGSDANEGTTYRKRKRTAGSPSPLGDIVNSTPALVGDLVNMFYQALPAKTGGLDYGAEKYATFIDVKKQRKSQLIVGANDGMLHGFSDADGSETFAFVPGSILGSLEQLANTAYTHRYFVDGPIYESDVYDKGNGEWRNLVQGFGGAGGKYLYTINMPVVANAESAPTKSDILWEIDNNTTNFSELGYVLVKPETGVTPDGNWVTIFGNGYESASGNAQLFIVDALTGALIKKIDTGAGPAGPSDPANGLGGVGVVRDAQRRIVAAYAGDLYGNLWKFDLSSSDPDDWTVAFGGQPLFIATNSDDLPEPITAKPQFRAFPTDSTLVLFGTGKLFESGDETDQDERALYGVWDQVPIGLTANDFLALPGNEGLTVDDLLVDVGQLVEQTVNTTPVPDATDGRVYRTLNLTAVDYGSSRGWRMPLTISPGERVIDQPQARLNFIFMQTVTPSASEDECEGAGLARRAYVLDPFMSDITNAAVPFDADGDGVYESHVVDLQGTGENVLIYRGANSSSGVILGAGATPIEVSFGSGLVRRWWRQLVTHP